MLQLHDTICAMAALAGAAVNAAAGGGTFLTFPALTGIAGLTEKTANITSTVGLWPGYAASVVAAHPELKSVPRRQQFAFAILGLVGGTIGAILLLTTPVRSFRLAIPWLLLLATVLLALGKRLGGWARRWQLHHEDGRLSMPGIFILTLVAVYNGYFGAGGGVLLMAALSLTGMEDVHRANAIKLVLQMTANAAAVLVFLAAGVNWKLAGVMAIASAVGGFVGIGVIRRMPAKVLRGVVLAVAVAITAIYFWKLGNGIVAQSSGQ